MRVAIATKDGWVIYEHFGHCSRYSIVEIENDSYRFVEFRDVEPPCHGGDHTMEALLQAARRLKDCTYVVVGQIGMGAQQILTEKNLITYVFNGSVEDALSNIIKMKGRYRDGQEAEANSNIR